MENYVFPAIAFIACLTGSWLLVEKIRKSHAVKDIQEAAKTLYDKTSVASEARIREEEKIRMEDGYQEKTDFFYKMDLALEHSGLKRKLPFLNTEIFLLFVTICFVVTLIVVSRTFNFFFAVICSISLLFVFYLIVYCLKAKNEQRIEENI